MSHEESSCTCYVAGRSVDDTGGERRLEGRLEDDRVPCESVCQVMVKDFNFYPKSQEMPRKYGMEVL